MLSLCSGGHGLTYDVGGSRYHPPGGGVAELHDAPLPAHDGQELHRRPGHKKISARHIHTHPYREFQKLVPGVTRGPSRPLPLEVSGGLA